MTQIDAELRADLATIDLAIIGGGAAGVITAIHALAAAAQGQRIALIEPGEHIARGIAYATTRPEHLLNVPAGRMSAFPEAPADFLDWLRTQHPQGTREEQAEAFAPRRAYGDYLQQRLQEAQERSAATLLLLQTAVDVLQPQDDGRLRLRLHDGRWLQADAGVLAVGNSLRPLPGKGGEALAPTQRVQAWDYPAVQAIGVDASVCIVGTGLSMADCVVTLAANGHRGPIHLLSRHGLLPLPHDHGAAVDFDVQALLSMGLRGRLRALRRHAREAVGARTPWQSVMDRIRPWGQALWQSLEDADQRRFLRHVVRYWDIHRHRIAEDVHGAVQAMQRSGQLQVARGRLQRVEQASGGRVRVYAEGAHGSRVIDADVVINATGVETAASRLRASLLQGLLADGVARPGPHGLGLDTDADGLLLSAQGTTWPQLSVVGSLRIGTLWESLAIPELRGQAQLAARRQMARTGASSGPIA